jgi:hypothetical protein
MEQDQQTHHSFMEIKKKLLTLIIQAKITF